MGRSNFTSKKTSGDTSDQVITALRRIIQIIDQDSRRLYKRMGLTGPQLIILKEISEFKEISVGDIAKKVSLTQGTMTGILERMEKRELVERRRSSEDKRRVMVKITDPGRKLLQNSPPLMQEIFVEKFNQLPDWIQTMILSSLQHLAMIMDAKNEPEGDSVFGTRSIKEWKTESRPDDVSSLL